MMLLHDHSDNSINVGFLPYYRTQLCLTTEKEKIRLPMATLIKKMSKHVRTALESHSGFLFIIHDNEEEKLFL